MPYKQKLSIEQKVEIVQVYLKGQISIIEAARRSGVRRQSFERRYATRSWTLRFEQMGESGLENRRGHRKKDQVPRTELEKAQIEIEQLKHKQYLTEMENGLLK